MKGRKKEKKNVKKESDANEYLNFLTQGKVLLLIISQIPPLLLEKITYLPKKKKNPKNQTKTKITTTKKNPLCYYFQFLVFAGLYMQMTEVDEFEQQTLSLIDSNKNRIFYCN